MANTTFIDKVTVIATEWLNDTNAITYGISDTTNVVKGDALVGFKQSGTGAVGRTVHAKLGEIFSVTDFSGVDATGASDSAAGLTSALTAASGKTLRFPYELNGIYRINSNLTMPSPAVNFIMDAGVTFTGTGKLPPAVTNTAQLNTAGYTVNFPSGGALNVGNSALQVESLPVANYIGNAVPLYTGCESPQGNPNFTGFIWGGNSLISLNPSTGVYNGIGWEFDLNNYYANGVGQGVLITGVGNFNPQAGVVVERADTSDWQFGGLLKDFQTGLRILGTGSVAAQTGLDIRGLQNGADHVLLNRGTDTSPTGQFIRCVNTANTLNLFQVAVTATGSNTPLSLSVGGSAALTVSVGAADSAGAGFRTLRVPN